MRAVRRVSSTSPADASSRSLAVPSMPSSTSNIVTYISRDHPRYSFDRSVPSVTAAAKSPVNPLADIRVVSSDGVVFPTQKLFLLAASDVFADMLATGSDAGSTSGNPSELPQVKLNETSKDLGVFLGFVDRKIVRPQLLSLEQAEKSDQPPIPLLASNP